jgi:hypothetical protein
MHERKVADQARSRSDPLLYVKRHFKLHFGSERLELDHLFRLEPTEIAGV